MRSFMLLVLVIAIALPAAAETPEEQNIETLKQQAGVLLSGVEYQPPASVWKKLGEDGYKALLAIYHDKQQPYFKRLRAVSALAHYKAPAVTSFLKELARNDKAELAERRTAVMALALSDPDASRDTLRQLSTHSNVYLREAVILTGIAHPELVGDWLELRIKAESELFLTEKLKKLKLKVIDFKRQQQQIKQ